jgi:regulation of enolase protein 1 (concanavalin A-like superfamily)
MLFFHRATCVCTLGLALFGAAALNAATGHVNSGPLNINGQNGTTIENLHITNPSGPCVTITNSTNITIHNSEIGPCGAQAVVTTGGDNIKILDSFLHAEVAGIVNKSGNQSTYDTGDNILCNNTTHLFVQGNVIAWGEDNVFTVGCSYATFRGNFFLNPINSINLGNRGASVQALDGSIYTTVDNNYFVSSTDTATWKYATNSTDIVNFGSVANGQNYGGQAINNYITGGNFPYGCGINMEGGNNGGTISNNVIVNSGACGIAIEDGFNYTVSGNKVMNQQAVSNNLGFAIMNLYSADGHSCGNIALSNNLGYSLRDTGAVVGIWDSGQCSNVSYGSGNIFDSTAGGAAYNAMNPVNTKLPPPMIPPAPYSCAVISPYTNQTAQSCGGGVSPTVTMTQPGANTTLSGTVQFSATPSSGVTSVSFVRDGSTLIGQATASPWTISVDTTTIPNGTHSLAAVATQSGVQATSASIPVTVQNTTAAPAPTSSSGSLNTSVWTLVNPAGGGYSISGPDLLLNVPAGSNHDPCFGGVNNSVRVMQRTGNTGFTIEAKFDSIPAQMYQFEGILVQQDAAHYLWFQFGSTGSQLIVNSAVAWAGAATSQQSATISATGSIWMRVQRNGDTWTQSWSPNGTTWTTVGSFTQGLTMTSIGPFAGNYNDTASATPGFTGKVAYFHNINPPAPGPAVSDTFDLSPVPTSGGLNTNVWKFVAPAGGSYKMNGTQLLLTAPAGSNHDPAYGGVNNSVQVVQTTSNADFALEAKFDSIPNQQYQFEGIEVGQDAGNYLRFQFGSTGSILVVGASSIVSKVETGLFMPVITLPAGTTSLWMRVTKSGNNWVETWSTDGKTYNTAGSFTQALTVSSIGLFSGNYNNTASAAPAFTSAVSYFANTAPAVLGPPASYDF